MEGDSPPQDQQQVVLQDINDQTPHPKRRKLLHNADEEPSTPNQVNINV